MRKIILAARRVGRALRYVMLRGMMIGRQLQQLWRTMWIEQLALDSFLKPSRKSRRPSHVDNNNNFKTSNLWRMN